MVSHGFAVCNGPHGKLDPHMGTLGRGVRIQKIRKVQQQDSFYIKRKTQPISKVKTQLKPQLIHQLEHMGFKKKEAINQNTQILVTNLSLLSLTMITAGTFCDPLSW